jgi:hypothetical protein
MIDWIDAMARSWGYQLRRHHQAEGKLPSLAGRVMELGPVGAAIRGAGGQVFGEGLLGDALEFHVAWKQIDNHDYREILATHYIDPSPVKRKAPQIGIAISTYWQRLDYAQRAAASVLGYGQRTYGQLMQKSAN